ncbi:hypothetical protein H6F38_10135 [Paenibacillus sp. EKM208P]|nr:hypothetical protein H6F38_10135 [Paenibacillus sp. EKM208P]
MNIIRYLLNPAFFSYQKNPASSYQDTGVTLAQIVRRRQLLSAWTVTANTSSFPRRIMVTGGRAGILTYGKMHVLPRLLDI